MNYCENTVALHKCNKVATTTRQEYRWGDKAKNEPTVVHFTMHFCESCAALRDDVQQEGAIEAQAS